MTMSYRNRIVENLLNGIEDLKAREQRRTRDTLLTVPTDTEWKAYMEQRAKMDPGKYWDGISAGLSSMEPALREEIYKRFDNFREQDRRKTADAAHRDFDPLGRWPQAEQNRALNEAARAKWGLPPVR
jgi:hypothetical protein